MNQESITASKRIIAFVYSVIAGLNIIIYLPAVAHHLGFTWLSKQIYNILGFLCHQMPHRSFFLFGESFMYSKDELLKVMNWSNMFTLNFQDRYTCGDSIGCKFGVCSRCTGIYTGMAAGSIGGWMIHKKKMPLWGFGFLLIPMILDGGIQLIASIVTPRDPFYESNNTLRFITGFLFGIGFGVYAFGRMHREVLAATNEVPEQKIDVT
jgi:uncharacterized membrane protein